MPFSTTGSWNLGKVNLRDFGLTERLGGNPKSISGTPSTLKTTMPTKVGGYTPVGDTYGKVKGDDIYKPSSDINNDSGSGGGDDGGVDERMAEVDSIYEDIMNYIGKQRKNLNASKSQLLGIAQRPYEAMMPKVRETAEQGVNTLKGYITDVGMEGEDALNSARRLHNELNTRNQQVFGSGALSSAGQASSELLNRDTYKQFGDIRQQVSNQVRTLENEIGRVQRERDVQLNELESQKQQALAQAELRFRDAISQLDQYEAQTRSSKKVDKLNALKEYRAEVRDTNRYFREMQSDIATNSAYTQQQLDAEMNSILSGINSTTSQAGQGVDAMGDELTMGGEQMAYNQALGVDPSVQSPLISGYRKPLEDEISTGGGSSW